MFGKKKEKESIHDGVLDLDDLVEDNIDDVEDELEDELNAIAEDFDKEEGFDEDDTEDPEGEETDINGEEEFEDEFDDDEYSEEDEYAEEGFDEEDFDDVENFEDEFDEEEEFDYEDDFADDTEFIDEDDFAEEGEMTRKEKKAAKKAAKKAEKAAKKEANAEKRAKRKKTALKVLLGFVIALAAIYIGVAIFFWKFYFYGTEINGTNFQFKTVASVEKYMEEQVNGYELALKENTGNTERINGANIDLAYQKSKELQKILDSQKPYLWPEMFFKAHTYKAGVTVSYDEEKLTAQINSLNCMKEDTWTDSVNAYPSYSNGTYTVTKEVFGTKINTEVFNEKVKEAITEFQSELVLEDAGCYSDPKFTADSQEVADAMNTMNNYIKSVVTYDTGDVVSSDMIASWLGVDDNMAVTIDEAKVKEYLKSLGEKYDTVGKEKSITTPTGKQATVSGGNYGWTVNEAGELTTLLENIKAGQPVTRELQYKTKAVSHDGAEWGNTYVEVDISAQHLWYVENGAVKLETAVVTGKMTSDRMTHTGAYYIYFKQRNRVLRGTKLPDGTWPYETPVSYWMAFNGGEGLHDANWRSSFGGTIYKSSGSHGCVNMPPAKAGELYGMISQGTPVIVHN